MKTEVLLSAIQQLVIEVSAIERRHYQPGTNRRENVAEHSLSVATLAWFLHGQTPSQANLHLILQYAIVHDFVEVHAGDVNTFASPSERAAKENREQIALQKIAGEFHGFPHMVAAMRAYQAMQDPEARFVWTADKIQQLIMGQLDGWRAYREKNITRVMFDTKMEELLAKASPELQDIFAGVIAWSRESYPS